MTNLRKLTETEKEKSTRAFCRALDIFVSQVNMAAYLGVTQQSISRYKAGHPVPPELAIKIFFATDKRVKLHELAPDIYPISLLKDDMV